MSQAIGGHPVLETAGSRVFSNDLIIREIYGHIENRKTLHRCLSLNRSNWDNISAALYGEVSEGVLRRLNGTAQRLKLPEFLQYTKSIRVIVLADAYPPTAERITQLARTHMKLRCIKFGDQDIRSSTFSGSVRLSVKSDTGLPMGEDGIYGFLTLKALGSYPNHPIDHPSLGLCGAHRRFKLEGLDLSPACYFSWKGLRTVLGMDSKAVAGQNTAQLLAGVLDLKLESQIPTAVIGTLLAQFPALERLNIALYRCGNQDPIKSVEVAQQIVLSQRQSGSRLKELTVSLKDEKVDMGSSLDLFLHIPGLEYLSLQHTFVFHPDNTQASAPGQAKYAARATSLARVDVYASHVGKHRLDSCDAASYLVGLLLPQTDLRLLLDEPIGRARPDDGLKVWLEKVARIRQSFASNALKHGQGYRHILEEVMQARLEALFRQSEEAAAMARDKLKVEQVAAEFGDEFDEEGCGDWEKALCNVDTESLPHLRR